MQSTDEFDPTWQKFQHLHDQYQTILHEWIDSESPPTLDKKYLDMATTLFPKTNLPRPLFNTYHVVEEHFIQLRLQKWIKQQIQQIPSIPPDWQVTIPIENKQDVPNKYLAHQPHYFFYQWTYCYSSHLSTFHSIEKRKWRGLLETSFA